MHDNVMTGRVLAIAIAVIALAFVAVDLESDDGSDDGGTDAHVSDYSLLGDASKVAAGMTVESDISTGSGSASITYVVRSVTDGKVIADKTGKATDLDASMMGITLDTFAPENTAGIPYFDYTKESSASDGVTVKADGSTYTLNGGEGVVYKDLRIVYASGKVVSVDGNVSFTLSEYQGTLYSSMAFRTTDGSLTFSSGYTSQWTGTAEEFVKASQQPYDKDSYEGAMVTAKDGQYAGLAVKVYTVDGTVADATYKGLELYVCNGYVVGENGMIDGSSVSGTLSIWMGPRSVLFPVSRFRRAEETG